MFSGYYKLTLINIKNFKANKVSNMVCIFYRYSSFTSNFNILNAIYLLYIFIDWKIYCYSYIDVSKLNTQNKQNIGFMFKGFSSLTSLDVSHFNVNKITGNNSMYNGYFKMTYF